MGTLRPRLALGFAILLCTFFFMFHVHGQDHHDQIRKIQDFRDSLLQTDPTLPPLPSPTPSPTPSGAPFQPSVYQVTSYGADPTGKEDSTEAVMNAITDALNGPSDGSLFSGIQNLGGARVDLEGGTYVISRPLQFPVVGRGNLIVSETSGWQFQSARGYPPEFTQHKSIHGGTLKASDTFPGDKYIIDLTAPSGGGPAYSFEFITFRDLLLNSNFRGGGIQVEKSLRISIDNCYITHFTTNGILVKSGHETYIRNTFLGQHITAGGDPGERSFSGTAINLMGNDNALTDVVIFSAQIGVMISGQANLLSGVHCYNKATGFGGIGIYVKLPGKTQTRIVNSYMDYTGIVAEDPVQLHISNTFFLGDANVVLKSVNGIIAGVNIVDNMFSGSGKGIGIVQLDQKNKAFAAIDEVVVDRNNVRGMKVKSTVGRGSVQGNGTKWTVDLNPVLLFPNLVKHVQYSFSSSDENLFPKHALRSTWDNRVVIESDVEVAAEVFVTVDQSKS